MAPVREWPVVVGAQAGLTAAALVGLLEAVVVAVLNPGLEEVYVLPAAIVAYGLLGSLVGALLGAVSAAVGRRALGSGRWQPSLAFTLPFAGVLSGLTLVVGRFRLVRDALGEHALPPVIDLVLALGLLAVGAGLVGVGEWILRRDGAVATWGRWSASATFGLFVLMFLIAYSLSGPASGRRAAAGAGAADARPNLILIVVDTLRADRVSAYGYSRRTPAMDRLAQDGTLFVNAIAQASWTKPSFASFFTSLYPSGHQTYRKLDVLPDRVLTLAETLAAGGYYTAAFLNNPNVSPAFNFQQGFLEYHYLAPRYFFYATESISRLALYGGLRLVRERFLSRWKYPEHYYWDARKVTDRAISWFKDQPPQPFFLLLHYMDPHDPYFVHPYNGQGVARVHTPHPDPAQAERLSALYDGEVAFLDEHLGRLFAFLRHARLYDGSVIVLTSDHGEEFYEHEGWWHGTTLYDEQIRIPLIIKPSGGSANGRRVEEQVRSIDVAPTLLEAASVPVSSAMQGQSLLGSARPGVEAVFAEVDFEGNSVRAIRRRDWKLIQANPGNPRGLSPVELYRLERDPGERQDLAADEPERARELVELLNRLAVEARRGQTGPLARP
ncbi:MAG: sulfatase [Candidatus Methylomirabilales bacterium]